MRSTEVIAIATFVDSGGRRQDSDCCSRPHTVPDSKVLSSTEQQPLVTCSLADDVIAINKDDRADCTAVELILV